MGAVVETPSIYLDMTARDNMKQQYQILGQPGFEGIDELLELVGLGDTGKKKVKDFPLGMRQRLGIAIALAGNPDFLVRNGASCRRSICPKRMSKGCWIIRPSNGYWAIFCKYSQILGWGLNSDPYRKRRDSFSEPGSRPVSGGNRQIV